MQAMCSDANSANGEKQMRRNWCFQGNYNKLWRTITCWCHNIIWRFSSKSACLLHVVMHIVLSSKVLLFLWSTKILLRFRLGSQNKAASGITLPQVLQSLALALYLQLCGPTWRPPFMRVQPQSATITILYMPASESKTSRPFLTWDVPISLRSK